MFFLKKDYFNIIGINFYLYTILTIFPYMNLKLFLKK